jgi:acetyl-CoA carboxylase biotin carboxyl carrier protein
MVSRADIEAILAAFEKSDWRSIRLKADGVEVELSKDGPLPPAPPATAPEPTPAPAPTPTPTPTPTLAPPGPAAGHAPFPDGVDVPSPSLGTFYRAPRPGAPPLVEAGQTVAAGQELCLIEVMKLFTSVRAPVAGTIAAVHAADGDLVEHGQILFTIRAA